MVRRFIIRNLKVLILFLVFTISLTNTVLAQDITGENEEIKSEVKLVVQNNCKSINDELKKNEKLIEKKKEDQRKAKERKEWRSLGSCRITTYCPACNDPAGSYQSSSGITLYEGCVACSWLPIGATLRINGSTYTVVDRCGTNAIDVFVDTPYCKCNVNYYTEVKVKR